MKDQSKMRTAADPIREALREMRTLSSKMEGQSALLSKEPGFAYDAENEREAQATKKGWLA